MSTPRLLPYLPSPPGSDSHTLQVTTGTRASVPRPSLGLRVRTPRRGEGWLLTVPEFTYFFFFIFFFGLITWRNRPAMDSQRSGAGPEGSHRPGCGPGPSPGSAQRPQRPGAGPPGLREALREPGWPSATTALPRRRSAHHQTRRGSLLDLLSPHSPDASSTPQSQRGLQVAKPSCCALCVGSGCSPRPRPPPSPWPLQGPAQGLPWGASEAPLCITTSTHGGSFAVITEPHPQLLFTYLF